MAGSMTGKPGKDAFGAFQRLLPPQGMGDMPHFVTRLNEALETLYEKVYGAIELADMAASTRKIISAKSDTEVVTKLVSDISAEVSAISQRLDSITQIVKKNDDLYSCVTQTPTEWRAKVYARNYDASGDNYVRVGRPTDATYDWSSSATFEGCIPGHGARFYVEGAAGIQIPADPMNGDFRANITVYSTKSVTVRIGDETASVAAGEMTEIHAEIPGAATSELGLRITAAEPAHVDINNVYVYTGGEKEPGAYSEYRNITETAEYKIVSITREGLRITDGATGESTLYAAASLERTGASGEMYAKADIGAFRSENGLPAGGVVNISIPVASWSGGAAFVPMVDEDGANMISGDSAEWPELIVVPAAASYTAYTNARISAEVYGSSGTVGIRFSYGGSKPTAALTVKVYLLGGLTRRGTFTA